MTLDSLQDLFIRELKDLYDVERQGAQALPQLLQIMHSDELKSLLSEHLEEANTHLAKLESLCSALGIDPTGRTSMGIEGMIDDAIALTEETSPSPTLDAALIAAIQKMEHYEIASYGTATAYAKQLQHNDAEESLHEMLEEEKEADKKLTQLAEGLLNKEAANQPGKYAM
jgi:ferritin-like metal-binding protein YciE